MKSEYNRLATLYDIKTFCDRVNYIKSNWTRTEINDDFTKQDALHHNFAKIGEAVNRILKSDPELASRIPDIRQVVNFRNVLLHSYDEVDHTRVWSILTDNFPILNDTIKNLLAEFESAQQTKSQ